MLGLLGLALSVHSFLGDLESAKSGAAHARKVENKLETIESKVGQPYNGGVFLYEEPVEIYWNDWWAHPLKSRADVKEYGQAEPTITGEGKTVDFVGLLSINCENGKHTWRGTQNFDRTLGEQETDEIVPPQVIKNAHKLFCDV